MKPFFSVCIETYNRSQTIQNTLESVQDQIFRDFELIIVDNKSTDDTVKIVKDFFKSKFYKDNPFKGRLEINNCHLSGVKNWNGPLKLATGRYIAILEGDDVFPSHHLNMAYNILFNDKTIGIYAVNDNRGKIFGRGEINSKDYINYLSKLKGIPAPSSTIFIRKNQNDIPYFFNDNYLYSPETELYYRIAKDGYSGFHNPVNTVTRGNSSRTSIETLTGNVNAFADRLTFLSKIRDDITEQQYLESLNRQLYLMLYNFSPRYYLFKQSRCDLFRYLLVCLKFFSVYSWKKRSVNDGLYRA